MPTALLQIASLILLIAAVSDLCWRRIPNILVLALAIVAILHLAFDFNAATAAWSIAAAAVLLLLLAVAWTRNWIGGGDVKLGAAAALLIGYRQLPDFLVLTAFLGGGVALLTLLDIYFGRFYGRSLGFAFPAGSRRAGEVAAAKPSVPYGVAISAAGLLMLFQVFPPR